MKPIIISLIFLFNCAGTSGTLQFNNLNYPVSMSSYVIVNNNILEEKNLKYVGNINFKKKFWGIFFTMYRLTKNIDISNELNAQIKSANGNGATNLEINLRPCRMNYIFPMPWIWFYPSCAIVSVKGKIFSEN